MDRYDAWKPRQLELQHAAGLDPDGPPRPMQARLTAAQTREVLRRASDIAERHARLRRALHHLW